MGNIFSSFTDKFIDDVVRFYEINGLEEDEIPMEFFHFVRDAFMKMVYGDKPFSDKQSLTPGEEKNVENEAKNAVEILTVGENTVNLPQDSIKTEVIPIVGGKKENTIPNPNSPTRKTVRKRKLRSE